MSQLFTPITLRSLTLPNRVMVAPMCQYSADDGLPNAWHEVHLGSLATGSPGLLCIEATAVSDAGRITPGCLGLWSAAHELALTSLIKTVRATGHTHIAIQLGHAGRKAACWHPWHGGRQLPADGGFWQPIAPSPVGHYDTDIPPRPMDSADLAEVQQEFVEAALRAVRAGCEAIELHGAHGYLLHQFLSPLSNRRIDAYGGSLENRMRYPLEVFAAVRAAVPAGVPVGIRISATDWMEHTGEPSWTLDQSVVLAGELERAGCDFLHVSTGGLAAAQQIKAGPCYQVVHAETIKRALGATARMRVIAVGGITEPTGAEAIVANGQADMVAMARAFMMNPRWTWRAAVELGATVDVPPQVLRATPAKIFRTTQ